MKKIIKNKKIIKENKIKKINEKNEVGVGGEVSGTPFTPTDDGPVMAKIMTPEENSPEENQQDNNTQQNNNQNNQNNNQQNNNKEKDNNNQNNDVQSNKQQEQEKNKQDKEKIRKLLLEFKRELETAAKTDDSECYKKYVNEINKDKYIDNLKEKYISILGDIVDKFMKGGNIKEKIKELKDNSIDKTLKYIFKNIEEDYNFEGLNKYKNYVIKVLEDYNKEIDNINNDIYFSNKQIKDDMINKIKDLKQKQINLALQCGVEEKELEKYIEDDQNNEDILNLKQQLDSYIEEINDKLNEINNINELGLVKLSYRDEYQDIVNQLNEKIKELIK